MRAVAARPQSQRSDTESPFTGSGQRRGREAADATLFATLAQTSAAGARQRSPAGQRGGPWPCTMNLRPRACGVSRRGAGVVDQARLESVCAARRRGFESHPLRQRRFQTHSRRIKVPRALRSDELGKELGTARGSRTMRLSPDPALHLFRGGESRFRNSGRTIGRRFGHLLHYTTERAAVGVVKDQQLGFSDRGLWLSPTPYAGCMASQNLGLSNPCEWVFVVDVSSLPEVWGPGVAVPGFFGAWRGGGLEFYVPQPIPFSAVLDWYRLLGCGDAHGP